MILDLIKKENDIKKLNKKDYPILAEEIREFLVEKVSRKGGHLASNLGSVELTMALHLCMNFPEDKLIFDVGHQSYTHKLLTGRRDGFDSLRELDGMSGFPKRCESDCDAFNTGHSSTSISAAMGFAVARDRNHGNERVAAVIGDGSLTGGMAYEAMNSLAQLKTGLVIILNDNDMSIDKNVGGLSKYLNGIRVGSAYNDLKSGVENSLLTTKAGEKVARTLKKSKDTIKQLFVPGMFFEQLGITYVGPIDGHDINTMMSTFDKAFKLNKPIIIHVKTKKGKGYGYAEKRPDYYHGIGCFDSKTGKTVGSKKLPTNTEVFSKHLIKLGEKNEKIITITAAMAKGTGLDKFAARFPDRCFDVGIAEQHAVTFAAGLAAAGMTPVVAIYSSFLQRAYDQIFHDVCLQKLHVIFAVDRSGLVGQDGETHQGIYDSSYLSHLPNMTVIAPKNADELRAMMDFAVTFDGPIAIKYSRGCSFEGLKEYNAPIEYGKSEIIHEGSRVAILSCGHMIEEANKLYELLVSDGLSPYLINVRFITGIDWSMVHKILKNCDTIVTLEENISIGGYGERLMSAIADHTTFEGHITHIDGSIRKGSVEQGDVKLLRQRLGIDAAGLYERLKEAGII
ncbi:MAG: 1-deoxy-D-xylulose-5-phosphate synthase [Wujia sp.]